MVNRLSTGKLYSVKKNETIFKAMNVSPDYADEKLIVRDYPRCILDISIRIEISFWRGTRKDFQLLRYDSNRRIGRE